MAKGAKRQPTDAGFDRVLLRLGRRLKKLRTERGLTQEDMVGFGIERRRYQRIEKGIQPVTLRTVYRLSKVFKVSLVQLLG